MAIIVALSDSALGQVAVQRATEEAQRRGHKLILVANAPMPRTEKDRSRYGQLRRELEERVERTADKMRGDGVDCVPYVTPAPVGAADALLRAQEEYDGALIVVGIRRRSPVGKALLGSTSQTVLLHADCDVLGVKAPPGTEDQG